MTHEDVPMIDDPVVAQAGNPKKAGSPTDGGGDSSLRETIESIVFAFVLAFTFRAFIVEAFVIPTGSMAPTLLGEHLQAQCPQCGYRFKVEASSGGRQLDTHCPMCQMGIYEAEAHPASSGDRILVLKYLYAFREPQRWDVVVFKNPQPPGNDQHDLQNYIKRLVGLPKEELRIVRGNIYVRDLVLDEQGKYYRASVPQDGDRQTKWHIARRSDRPKIQRKVWQPIYHSDYVPLDKGDPSKTDGRDVAWKMPWKINSPAHVTSGDKLGTWRYDGHADAGKLRFDFEAKTLAYRNYYPYNGSDAPSSDHIEDMRLAATVIPEADGLELKLAVSNAELYVRAVIAPDGTVRLQVAHRRGDLRPDWKTKSDLDEPSTHKLLAKTAARVELWHVDQHISLWIDGHLIDEWHYDLDWLYEAKLGEKPGPTAAFKYHNEFHGAGLPTARLTVQGAAAAIRSVDLDRDLYYTQTYPSRHRERSLGSSFSAIIGPDQFYCLGDNSPKSLDSRSWVEMDPAVRRLTQDRYYKFEEDENDGRRILEKRPGLGLGLVPRELMIGRAFFVYWPAAHRVNHAWPGTIPNFADMRFIR